MNYDDTDPPPVYNVAYLLTSPFSGAPNVITNVLPNQSNATVSPAPSSRTAYVALDGPPPTPNVKVVGQVQMNITISDGTSNVLYPLGLAVQNPSVRARPTAFPLATVLAGQPTTITLGDTASSDPNGTEYEFVILFQDSFGNFGTLDPRITNDQS